MAEEFYLVKIGTINLTVDGLVTGAPCLNKVSGLAKPTAADAEAFERAVDEVARATTALLHALPERGAVRTREREKEKAKAKWALRVRPVAARS